MDGKKALREMEGRNQVGIHGWKEGIEGDGRKKSGRNTWMERRHCGRAGRKKSGRNTWMERRHCGRAGRKKSGRNTWMERRHWGRDGRKYWRKEGRHGWKEGMEEEMEGNLAGRKEKKSGRKTWLERRHWRRDERETMKEEIWKEERHGRMKEGKKIKRQEGRYKKNNKNFDGILTRQTNTTHSNIQVERQASKTQPDHVTEASETWPEHVTACNRSEWNTSRARNRGQGAYIQDRHSPTATQPQAPRHQVRALTCAGCRSSSDRHWPAHCGPPHRSVDTGCWSTWPLPGRRRWFHLGTDNQVSQGTPAKSHFSVQLPCCITGIFISIVM